jgi:glycosyltransferase involved in cell wall biosynthesis
MHRKAATDSALIVTTRNVHYREVAPVIDTLKRRGCRVRVLRFERVWERIERFLSKTTRRRSFASFYSKSKVEQQGTFKSLAYRLAPKLVYYVAKMLRLEMPGIIIVLTDSTPPCRIAVLAGKVAKVPSLLLLHSGLIGWIYDCPAFVSDKIAVMGEFAKRVLIADYVDENKIVITGRPSYDALIRVQAGFDKKAICSRFGLNPSEKIAVYTTENLPPRESEVMARVVCKALKEFSGVQSVVKVHPSELDLSMYKNLTKELGLVSLITREASIYEVLYVCDVMITGFSATALDAMILDKPVIAMNLTGFEDPLPFAESGAAIGVYQEADLKEAIRKGLYDESIKGRLRKSREKFVFEHAYKKDGKASERVAELAYQMIRNAKSE